MLALAAIARACAAMTGTNSGRIWLLSKWKYRRRATPAGAEAALPPVAPVLSAPAAPAPASLAAGVPVPALATGGGAFTALLPAQPDNASSKLPATATMRFLCITLLQLYFRGSRTDPRPARVHRRDRTSDAVTPGHPPPPPPPYRGPPRHPPRSDPSPLA